MVRPGSGRQRFSIILFDLGNVLVRVDYPAFLRTLGFEHKMDGRELYELLEVESTAYETGKMAPKEYFAAMNRKLETSYSFEQFRKAWNAILPGAIPGMLELITVLATKYRLMVLSNTNKLHFDQMMELLPVLQRFERFFLSYEIGFLKPDPAIYEHALSKVDVPAREMLFIDDLKPNVLAARRVGMAAVAFQGVDALREELKHLGIL